LFRGVLITDIISDKDGISARARLIMIRDTLPEGIRTAITAIIRSVAPPTE